MMANIILILYVLTTTFGLIVLKLGSASGAPIAFTDNRLIFNLNLQSIMGFILYGISFLLYTYLISKNDLGYIIPLTSAFVYVSVFFASYIVFHESFNLLKIISIAMIVGGIILLSMSK